MQIDDNWKFIFRYVPGVLRLLRLMVFLFLESTAVRFNTNYKGGKARNLSAERSKAYIQSTAPGELTSMKRNTFCQLFAYYYWIKEQYWPLLTPKYEIGCKARISDLTSILGYILSLLLI